MASKSGSWATRVSSAAGVFFSIGLVAAAHASPGALTSASELAAIRAAADAGRSPYKEDRSRLMNDARKSWAWGSISGPIGTTGTPSSKKCQPIGTSAGADYLLEGAPDAYAQVLGAHLSGDMSLAQQARGRVLEIGRAHV